MYVCVCVCVACVWVVSGAGSLTHAVYKSSLLTPTSTRAAPSSRPRPLVDAQRSHGLQALGSRHHGARHGNRVCGGVLYLSGELLLVLPINVSTVFIEIAITPFRGQHGTLWLDRPLVVLLDVARVPVENTGAGRVVAFQPLSCSCCDRIARRRRRSMVKRGRSVVPRVLV
jgi:hypothetical protein